MVDAEKTGRIGMLGRRLRRPRTIVSALMFLALAPLAHWAFIVFVGDNFHAVIPGQVYRSAQLSPRTLEDVVQRHGIRTVVNLRGCSDSIGWYTEECRTAQRLNLNFEDIGFSAYRFPHEHELRELVDVLEYAEYPLVLHCRRGADRTGLAAAMVLLMKTEATPAEALQQLSIRFGHVPLGKPAYLNWFFVIYDEWLRETGHAHTPERFRHWARTQYCGGWYRCAFANFKHGTARAGDHLACEVEAHNTGLRSWKMRPILTTGMHLNYWVRDDKDGEVYRGHAGLFERIVAPGEKVHLAFSLPPLPAGRYQLFGTMENANNFHLYQTGSEPLEVEFEIPR